MGLVFFLSEDPIGLAGGLNLHSYVNNNPITYTDPLGLYTSPLSFDSTGRPFPPDIFPRIENRLAPLAPTAGQVGGFAMFSAVAYLSGGALAPVLTRSLGATYGPALGHGMGAILGSLGRQHTRSLLDDDPCTQATFRPSVLQALGEGVIVFAATGTLLIGAEAAAAARSLDGTAETYLYQKIGPNGEHLKYGITSDPARRYTAEELGGGQLRIIGSGSKSDILALERKLHETLPLGPEEGQTVYITIQTDKGLRPPPYDTR